MGRPSAVHGANKACRGRPVRQRFMGDETSSAGGRGREEVSGACVVCGAVWCATSGEGE